MGTGFITDVMLNSSKSVLMKKQAHLHLGWPEWNFLDYIFGLTVPFNLKLFGHFREKSETILMLI